MGVGSSVKNLIWWQFLCPHSIPPGFKPYFWCFFANPIFTWLLVLNFMKMHFYLYYEGSGGRSPPEKTFWEFLVYLRKFFGLLSRGQWAKPQNYFWDFWSDAEGGEIALQKCKLIFEIQKMIISIRSTWKIMLSVW